MWVQLLVFTSLAAVCLFLMMTFDPIGRWRMRHFPGPPALPFLGHLPQIFKHGTPAFFKECRDKYGPIFKVAFGRSWMVVVTDPELIHKVGGKLLNRPSFRGLMLGDYQEMDRTGLVAAKDGYWRLVRSSWQPAFSSASLSGYLPRMRHCAAQLAERMEAAAAAGGGAAARRDVWRELGSMTLQVVGSTAYGVDFHAMEPPQQQQEQRQRQEPGSGEGDGRPRAEVGKRGGAGGGDDTSAGRHYGRVLVEACRDVFRYSSVVYGSKYSRVALLLPELRPLVSRLAHALPDAPFAKLLQARAHLRNACVDLISAWRGGKHASGDAAPTVDAVATAVGAAGADSSGKSPAAVEPGSFLGLMLSARDKATGQGLSDSQVAAQVQTFILAGYETTANALAFTVYCLARNPEAESRMLDEIDSVLGPYRQPDESDLPRLAYTEAVFNEAMRLFPPAHATNRHVDGGPIQVGGYTVPAGIPVFMSIFSSHHNPDVWPRADEFIPERFVPSSSLHPEVAARVPGAHAPFGYGSRMCIGWKFAVQEAKVALATLYQRLRFELEPGQVPLATAVGITLAPRHGVWVRPVLRRGA